MIYRSMLVALLAFALSGPHANAQDETPPPPPPPCSAEVYSQFDFWLGSWEVHGPQGQYAGHNLVEKMEGGCLIRENWTSANGTTGQSYNFYNPVTDEWRQLWVSAGTIIDYTGGLTETGSMKLEGSIVYTGPDTSFPFTGEWTLNEDGTVTQHFEQYDPEAETWNVWFTGIYSKADEAPQTETIIQQVSNQIIEKGCWRSFKDLPDWESYDPKIAFQLDENGSLVEGPIVIGPWEAIVNTPEKDQNYAIAIERAKRAITLCEPFNLSANPSPIWLDRPLIITFDEAADG